MVRKSLVALVACGAVAGFAPAAFAEGGGGLYAPFPEPVVGDQAQSYLEQLGVRARQADLERGRLVGSAARWRSDGPPVASRRAGVNSGSSVGLLAALLAALALAVVVERRRWT